MDTRPREVMHPWEEKWNLGDRLPKGGQGVTHAVVLHEDDSVHGALKYLKNNRDMQARGRMRREVVNLRTLAGTGGVVPRVLDDNTDMADDPKVELYVVMDFIEGPTLDAYVRERGALPVDQAVRFVLSLTHTIQIAHDFPILHRDLKPDNIIVRDDATPELVVLDYGLSFNNSDETLTEPDERFRNRFLDLPETNTPGGNRRDPRSDLTAACGILYFCLTGQVPGHLQDASGTLPHHRPGFSLRDYQQGDNRLQAIDGFLTRGFALVIANRFQSVDEMQDRLQDLLSQDAALDATDPIQLAAALSSQLRERDRVTQIAEFARTAESLFGHIRSEADKYAGNLGAFSITHHVGVSGRHVHLPPGLDFVAVCNSQEVLSEAHHDIHHCRAYAVGSQGERCVLLFADHTVPPGNTTGIPPDASIWRELAWYEGDPQPIFPLVSNSFREWVATQLGDLTEEILSSGQ